MTSTGHTIAGIQFTTAAAECMQEVGYTARSVETDLAYVRRMLANGRDRDALHVRELDKALDGAEPDRVQGWEDYVSAIMAAA